MNPEAQRIAIAEACGWEEVRLHSNGENVRGYSPNFDPDTESAEVDFEVLDYLNDLNAMHEAEKTLTAIQWLKYWPTLCSVVWGSPITMESSTRLVWEATAAQRAEAFLRTIGKWIDK